MGWNFRKGDTPKKTDAEKLAEVERRREYQRQYYYDHRDKAKAYQRIYNRNHKKSPFLSASKSTCRRILLPKAGLNGHDLQHMEIEKFARSVNKITQGRTIYVGV